VAEGAWCDGIGVDAFSDGPVCPRAARQRRRTLAGARQKGRELESRGLTYELAFGGTGPASLQLAIGALIDAGVRSRVAEGTFPLNDGCVGLDDVELVRAAAGLSHVCRFGMSCWYADMLGPVGGAGYVGCWRLRIYVYSVGLTQMMLTKQTGCASVRTVGAQGQIGTSGQVGMLTAPLIEGRDAREPTLAVGLELGRSGLAAEKARWWKVPKAGPASG
jgi:hypothetical protein